MFNCLLINSLNIFLYLGEILLYLIIADNPIFNEPRNGTNTVVDQCRGEKLSVGSINIVQIIDRHLPPTSLQL